MADNKLSNFDSIKVMTHVIRSGWKSNIYDFFTNSIFWASLSFFHQSLITAESADASKALGGERVFFEQKLKMRLLFCCWR